jgi:hypothetical protein
VRVPEYYHDTLRALVDCPRIALEVLNPVYEGALCRFKSQDILDYLYGRGQADEAQTQGVLGALGYLEGRAIVKSQGDKWVYLDPVSAIILLTDWESYRPWQLAPLGPRSRLSALAAGATLA